MDIVPWMKDDEKFPLVSVKRIKRMKRHLENSMGTDLK